MQTVRPYVRVSTEEQTDEGFSIPAQRQRIEDFCRSQGWIIAGWYIEEGRSAKDMHRPELDRLRADLAPGEIAVVYRLDRLTRSVLDLYTLLKEWDEQHVGFRSVTEVYDTTTAIGRLFLTLVAALAQWERENLGERVKVGMLEMVKQGKWHGGLVPYGYDYDQAARHLVVNHEEAMIVREIFQRYAAGEGSRAIAIDINGRRLRTKFGAEWSPSTVYYILRSAVYQGHVLYNKKGKSGDPLLVENVHEPIVTNEEVAAVQTIVARNLDKHPRQISSTFALTGIARCGLCGGRVGGKTQPQYDKKTKERRWQSRDYWCNARKIRKSCTLPSMTASRLEAAVLQQLNLLANPATLRQLAASETVEDTHEKERGQLNLELRSISRKKLRWHDAYEGEGITLAELKDRTSALQAREEAVHRRLKEIPPPAAAMDPDRIAEQLQELVWSWELANVEEQKRLLSELVESVIVYPGYRVNIKMKPLRL